MAAGVRATRDLADGLDIRALFENVAEAAGLSAAHRAFLPNAAKNIPIPGEHMPPGAAVLDFDRDGRQDLFVASGDGNRLYRNRGDGTFEDVAATRASRARRARARGARLRLRQRRRHGPLRDLPPAPQPPLPQPGRRHLRGGRRVQRRRPRATTRTSAAALDYDRDGRPDLYVLVYGQPDTRPQLQADNAPPNHLFRNNGDGTFTDVSKASRHRRHGLGAGAPERRPRRRPLARHLRRQRLREEHLSAQQRRRDVHESSAKKAGRPRSRLRDGRRRRRLRRRRAARRLRVELLLSPELVPQRPALPDAALSLLARAAARLAPPDGALARLVPLPQPRRQPLRAHVRRGRRLRTRPGPGAASSSTPTWTAGPTSSSSTAW